MQGFNMGRYVPPEHEGTVSANKLQGKHALGARARKIKEGILTVRFEMPFAIWCTTCKPDAIIGQGVRFNAEKKKVGNYYSTPIYSFRMKHTPCGGWIEIRTDPKNTAYVVTEGAKKRDTGEDKVVDGEIPIRTEEERERLRNDAFAALEVKITDRKLAEEHRDRIEELKKDRARTWEDPYEVNRRIRKSFRAERKVRQKNEEIKEGIKDRLGLGIELLDETDEDKQRAALVDFERVDPQALITKAAARPLFGLEDGRHINGIASNSNNKVSRASKKLKPAEESERRKELLQRELKGNTRAVIDPFLTSAKDWGPSHSPAHIISGIKRKKSQGDAVGAVNAPRPAESEVHDTTTPSLGLVSYDSD